MVEEYDGLVKGNGSSGGSEMGSGVRDAVEGGGR